MEIARIFFFIALYSLVACWLCNIMTLFSRPHKWCELLIFPQLIWFALGIIVFGYGEIYFKPQTETQWYLVTYGYPIFLLPVQIWSCNKFFLYTENKCWTIKNFYIWRFLKWFQCLCFLQFGFYWDMQLYGHKQHNYRNDANFRKLTGKVLCIAF